jgi:hypothetical protein
MLLSIYATIMPGYGTTDIRSGIPFQIILVVEVAGPVWWVTVWGTTKL